MSEPISLNDWLDAIRHDVPAKVHVEEGIPEDEVMIVWIWHTYVLRPLWDDEPVRKRHIALKRLEVAQAAREDLQYMPDGLVMVHRDNPEEIEGDYMVDMWFVAWKRRE